MKCHSSLITYLTYLLFNSLTFYFFVRYDESRKSTFNFSDEDLSGYVCSDDFERARLLLNAVAQVLVCTEKPNLGDNFFDIGGDSINMVQVLTYRALVGRGL